MKFIQATVADRLLCKADRLFNGTPAGRIIEILQNARRAGATRVEIDNGDGFVSVHDNGGGIEHFGKLLHMGSSGWAEEFESAEDPAGVGLFSLAPRTVTIRSRGHRVTVNGEGWTGAAVPVEEDPEPVAGTLLTFDDEPWWHERVEPHAVFCGIDVIVDGEACEREAFLSGRIVEYPELGYRITVLPEDKLGDWHMIAKRGRFCRDNVLINFHGQVITFCYRPVHHEKMHFLVELTGAPTDIRLMLPARTCLVKNAGAARLRAVLEREAYEYVRRCASHRLSFEEYQRGREIGFDLPEAAPTFEVGLLFGNSGGPRPVPVTMPAEWNLTDCYRLSPDLFGQSEQSNAHWLAALGEFSQPFVPVCICDRFDGYSWAQLPLIEEVTIEQGPTVHQDGVGFGQLACVEWLRIMARCSSGRQYSSPMCIGVAPDEESDFAPGELVLVTPAAESRIADEHLWELLGGPDDDGDTYETQFNLFQDELERFWAAMAGPDEYTRRRIISAIEMAAADWSRVTVSKDGTVVIAKRNGDERRMAPPIPGDDRPLD